MAVTEMGNVGPAAMLRKTSVPLAAIFGMAVRCKKVGLARARLMGLIAQGATFVQQG